MTIISSEELVKFRDALQDNDEALETIEVIEECNGNLVEAMDIVMINAGMEPVRGDDDWIDFDNIAKGLRNFICDPAFKDLVVNDAFALALAYLLTKTDHPAAFLILVLLYVVRKGINHFCGQEQAN
ncbi:hypothetical protein QUF74_08445 [Candidatus Halobeggiatoa sp. HSG11]|nr:hypothetical protein [Candidatus Halobeggiatoa sp. HSG11]